MSEWGMQPQTYGGSQQAGGGVEWFSSGGTGSYGAYGAYNPSSYGNTGGSGVNSFEDEPPLLEELGIDIGAIFLKTRAVLLWRFNSRYLDDLDMGGALIFVFVLAGLQLLMGKLHFGVTLGWSVIFSILLWFLLRQLVGPQGAGAGTLGGGQAPAAPGGMAPGPDGGMVGFGAGAGAGMSEAYSANLDLYAVCCVVGYSMLPLVVYCALAILMPRGLPSMLVAAACTLWAALTASRIFARRCPALADLKGVLLYPCLLTYATFALIIVY